jgi:hypothetical protein
MGLLMMRGKFSNCPFGEAKHCVINAFDTNYLLCVDEVMASTLHLTQNMEEELPGANVTAPRGPTSSISAFVACEVLLWLG